MSQFDQPSVTLLGIAVRAARRSRSLSMRRLADISGVDVSTISRIENGVIQKPQRESLNALARAINMPASILIELASRPATLPSEEATMLLIGASPNNHVKPAIEMARILYTIELLTENIRSESDPLVRRQDAIRLCDLASQIKSILDAVSNSATMVLEEQLEKEDYDGFRRSYEHSLNVWKPFRSLVDIVS